MPLDKELSAVFAHPAVRQACTLLRAVQQHIQLTVSRFRSPSKVLVIQKPYQAAQAGLGAVGERIGWERETSFLNREEAL